MKISIKEIITVLPIITVLISLFISIKMNNAETEYKYKLLAQEVAKRLYQKEIETRKSIYKIEQKIKKIEQNDSINEQNLLKIEQNYKNIISTIKKLNNEKIKNDIEINNSSDSSNWNWFKNRFPKFDNQLSGKASKITRKSSKD